MNQIQNETRAAVTCDFRLLGFVVLVLVLSFGSFTANAAPQGNVQKPNTNPVQPCCDITSINAATGVVTARNNANGQSFQFKVSDANLLRSLKTGQGIYANFTTQKVSVDGVQPCCGIVSFSNAGAANQQPNKAGGVGNTVAGQNLGNAANPGQPCCGITNINTATGVVTAKYLSTGQTFQFTVQNSALFHSFKVGQRFFANFNSRQVSLDGKTFTGIQSVGGSLPN
jgi:Cu/Ag efflux protein CusF